MIETELLTFPLEGKDKFIAEMKTFNVLFSGRGFLRSFERDCYVVLLLTLEATMALTIRENII